MFFAQVRLKSIALGQGIKNHLAFDGLLVAFLVSGGCNDEQCHRDPGYREKLPPGLVWLLKLKIRTRHPHFVYHSTIPLRLNPLTTSTSKYLHQVIQCIS
jgi:hypothetical protein